MIEKANDDIDYYERLKAELDEKEKEKGEGGEEVDYVERERLKQASYDAGAARQTIEKETAELHRLLNDESNEVIRTGAKKEYEKYLNRMKKIKKKEE